MLTLKSKFSEYFELIKGIACEDAVKPQSKIASEKTIGDVFAEYREDPNFDEGWGKWCLEKMGKELGPDIRLMIINKLKDPMTCLQLRIKCDFLTEDENRLLEAKYSGKLPTAEKELLHGKIKIKEAKKAEI